MKRIISSFVFAMLTLQGVAGWRAGMDTRESNLILNPPTIKVTEEEKGYSVVVTNESAVPLHYFGREEGAPDIFFEKLKNGKWDDSEWDWCGTGKRRYSIKPGASLAFHFPRSLMKPGSRVFIALSEEPDRTSLIKLVERKKEPNQSAQTTPVSAPR